MTALLPIGLLNATWALGELVGYLTGARSACVSADRLATVD